MRRIYILVKYFDFAILLLVKVTLFLKGRKYIRLLECEQIMHHFIACHLEIPNTHFYRIREEGGSGQISFVMLIFLLFLNQFFWGRGKFTGQIA